MRSQYHRVDFILIIVVNDQFYGICGIGVGNKNYLKISFKKFSLCNIKIYIFLTISYCQ